MARSEASFDTYLKEIQRHALLDADQEKALARRIQAQDVDHVDAEYSDGVLTLRIPLRESAKPRQVEVRRGADQAAIAVESN